MRGSLRDHLERMHALTEMSHEPSKNPDQGLIIALLADSRAGTWFECSIFAFGDFKEQVLPQVTGEIEEYDTGIEARVTVEAFKRIAVAPDNNRPEASNV